MSRVPTPQRVFRGCSREISFHIPITTLARVYTIRLTPTKFYSFKTVDQVIRLLVLECPDISFLISGARLDWNIQILPATMEDLASFDAFTRGSFKQTFGVELVLSHSQPVTDLGRMVLTTFSCKAVATGAFVHIGQGLTELLESQWLSNTAAAHVEVKGVRLSVQAVSEALVSLSFEFIRYRIFPIGTSDAVFLMPRLTEAQRSRGAWTLPEGLELRSFWWVMHGITLPEKFATVAVALGRLRLTYPDVCVMRQRPVLLPRDTTKLEDIWDKVEKVKILKEVELPPKKHKTA